MGENVEVIYNVPQEIPLLILLAIYFYMTGLSAGSFIMSTLAYGFGFQRYKPLGKIGVLMAIMLLILAPMNLLIDMTQPFRFWHLFVYTNPTSPISYGSFLLTLYPLNCVIYAFFMYRGNHRLTKTFGLIGLPLALSVHGYTGFIIAMAKGRILGNTALMPPLFIISAMVSGIGLMILVVVCKGVFFSDGKGIDRDLVFNLGGILRWTIVTDMVFLGTDIAVLLTSDTEAREAAHLILLGKFAPYFVGVEMGIGALIPLILLSLPRTRKSVTAVTIASFGTMFGIFAMRYVVVIGGQSLPLT